MKHQTLSCAAPRGLRHRPGLRRAKPWLAAVAALAMLTGAQAALVNRGGGMVYDDVLNITWLSDWNYANTTGYAVSGRMTQPDANDWAQSLVYGGYDDWRLPSTTQPDASCSDTYEPGFAYPTQYLGFNCTGSEMGHLFYTDLGGKAGETVFDASGDTALEIANRALFVNMTAFNYWSGTIPDNIFGLRWIFGLSDGEQDYAGATGSTLKAVAVRPGDVVNQAPAPQTLALVLLGLAGLACKRLAVTAKRRAVAASATCALTLCAVVQLPTHAATVHLADIVAAPTGVMDFEDAPDNFNGAIGRNSNGIRIQQIGGDGGNDMWSASGAGHGRSWYPDGGDDGWTRIRRVGGANFDAVSFFGGSGWITPPQTLYFELADDGVVVLSGTLAATFTGSWFGFAGGDFDELRMRASQGWVTGLLDCPSGGPGGSSGCNTAWVDDIHIGAADLPLPGTLGLAALALCGLGLVARGKRTAVGSQQLHSSIYRGDDGSARYVKHRLRWPRRAGTLLLCAATSASADVTWTGASLLGPYWHNALNWAAGQGPGFNDRALLGNADTFITQAQYPRAFQGSGTLTVQNSYLGMYGPPGVGSMIGTLRLEDSTIAGYEARVRAGSVWLHNASVGDALDGSTSELRADDGSTLSGSLTVQRSWALRLSGQTSWAAGSGDLLFANSNVLPQAALWVDANGVFTDHGSSHRSITHFQGPAGSGTPLLQIDGVYRKTGRADTAIELRLAVAGELAVEQGSITLWSLDKSISGRLNTAAGATLRSRNALNLVGAQVDNHGAVQVGDIGLAASADIDAATQWRGNGSLSVVGAQNLGIFSVITNHGGVHTGRLELRERTRLQGSGSFDTVELSILPASGSYVSIGTNFGTVGPSISASGTALLGRQTLVWGGSRLALNGASSWDSGDALIFVDNPFGGAVNGRNSRLSIGERGVFSDEACGAPCERQIVGPNEPGGELVIAGSYVKRGEHLSLLGQGLQFSNSGSIVAQQGRLRLFDVNNTGTLHADGGRIRVSGLAQWQAATQTLRSGTYRVNSFGVMALELGSDAQPLRIRINEATVLLDGPQATLLNRINDNLAVDAMAGLVEQRGSLQLSGGAQLLLGAQGLQQSGRLLIGQGSRLRTDGVLRQTAGATWLDGLLQAPQVALIGGRFGAGDADHIGQGHIEATLWGLGAGAVLDVDLADATWDRIDSNGAIALAGSLDADFDIHLASGAQASFRVLSAAGGVTGSFASITHNLDASRYRVWAEVGGTFVDLHVSAVPEPAALWLMAAGVGVLLRHLRHRSSRRMAPL